MKKILLISYLLSFSILSNAGGNTPYPIAPPMISYWAQCWMTVTAVSFGPKAQADIDQIKLTFDTALSIPLQKAIDVGTQQIVNAHANAASNVIKTLAINYSNNAESAHKMDMDMLDGELAFMQNLTEAEIKHKNKGFFTDGNGNDGVVIKESNSFEYAKTLCNRNKIMTQISGSDAKQSDANKLISSTKKAESENSQILSVEGIQNEIQKEHFEKYCTEEYYNENLCEEIAVYPLGDINASKLLFPDGTGRIDLNDDGIFKTQLTFNSAEELVAKDFVRNLIFANPTRKPTTEEQGNISKSDFIIAYNRKYSALNMANYSFELAINNRKAKTLSETGTPLSTYDLYRYQIDNTMSSDAKLTIENSKKKGVDFMIYSAMLVENKLELERSLQQERIENLIAAINSAKINNYNNINYLNSIK